jgi:DNA helicase-2/ATP-dependent DNA helicase PcrA
MDILSEIKNPCIILAGAGTGKTHTIVEKIKNLIKNKKVSPEKLVCLTFSNEAVNNLTARVLRDIPELKNDFPIIRTFHSFSSDLLKEKGTSININKEFTIIEPNQAKIMLHTFFGHSAHYCHKYISTISNAKDLGISIESIENNYNQKINNRNIEDIKKRYEELSFLLQTIHLKKESKDKKEIEREFEKLESLIELNRFLCAWKAYEKIKIKKQYLDYSDLNKKCLELLKTNPEISNKYDYIIVDEFQDTNKIQLEILFLLAPKGNITIVGDLNQSIYKFRGAYKENFSEFKKYYNIKNEEIFNLTKSRRSSNKILKLAHKLISNNYENKEECFEVKNYHDKEGENINITELKDGKEETRKIIEIIQERSKKIPLEEICILFRTHQQSRAIKNILEQNHIPYTSITGKSLLKDKTIKEVLDYLKIVQNYKKEKKGAEQSLWNIIYNSIRKDEDLIKIGEIIKKETKKETNIKQLIEKINESDTNNETKIILKVIKEKIEKISKENDKDMELFLNRCYSILGYISEEKIEENKETFLNLDKLKEFVKINKSWYIYDLDSFINYLKTIEKLEIEIEPASIEKKGVRLMTLHATKGLEFDTVMLTNMVQKKFPLIKISRENLIPLELYSNSKEKLEDYELKQNLFEERRLCYVAFTRAKNNLYLTYANEYSNKKFYPSQFLEEIEYKTNPIIDFERDIETKYLEISQKEIKIEGDTSKKDLKKILFSPSSLLDFNECQKKYEYKYIYGMPEDNALSWESMKLGSFIHHILEMGIKNNFKTLNQFINYSKEKYLEEQWKSVDLEEALKIINIFFERNKNKYSEKSQTEIKLNKKIKEYSFIGYADRIDFNEDGIEIIDYKTGKTPIKPKHRNWQLGYYAIAAKSLGKVKKITLDMLRLDKPIEFEIDEEGNAISTSSTRLEGFNINQIETELVKEAEKVLKAYQEGFKPCPIENNCKFCNEYIYNK